MPRYKKRCCIAGCYNTPRQCFEEKSKVKFYRFPSERNRISGNVVWITRERKKWIDAVKNHVWHPKIWEANHNTMICSVHFANDGRSEHPLRPFGIPVIFPLQENIGDDNQPLQLKQALAEFEAARHNANLRDVKLEHSDINFMAQHHAESHTNIAPPRAATAHRSISCQTHEVIDDHSSNDFSYFLCNLNRIDCVSSAEVQVNIPVNKTMDKMCHASLSNYF